LVLAAAAALFVAIPARAESVVVEFAGVSPGEVALFTLNGQGGSSLAGYFNYNRLGGSTQLGASGFRSFCIELQQGITSGAFTFDCVAIESRFDATRVSRLQELWGENIGKVNSDATAAAFQLAVWEITHEGGNNGLNLANGDFVVTNAAEAAAIAQNWLNNVDGQGTFETGLLALVNETEQDQLTVLVPAPPGVVMAGFGLVGLVGYGIRRRRKAA
jgi:MYXO-CTERM domain-containing protein